MLKRKQNMSSASKIDIIIDHNSVNFRPGDVIKGAVTLDLISTITVNEIKVTCRGVAQVKWKIGFGDKSTDYYDKEEYINFEESIYEKGKTNGKFQPGRHSFSFEVPLPEEIPASFEGPGCSIRYKVRAVVVEDKKFLANTVRTLHFKVKSNAKLNLSDLPFTQNEQKKRATKEHSTCTGAGPISATFTIDKGGYNPGQYITFRAQIQNHTSVKLKPPEVKLYRAIIRKVRFGPDRLIESKVDVKLEKMKNICDIIEKAKSVDWRSVRLLIRPNTCPLISHCDIISLSYFVCLDIKPLGLQIPIDIVMGTNQVRTETTDKKHWFPETTTVSSGPLSDEEPVPGVACFDDETVAMSASTPLTDGYPIVKMPGKRMKKKHSNLNLDTSEADSSYPHSDSGSNDLNMSEAEAGLEDTLEADQYNIGQDNDRLLVTSQSKEIMT